ncbi:unnamed protein product [Allacma fusca]|uniref:Uncharacterized protein n=1 Tax=Allacma fusca TaxID=39272 RepID=A0A8J2JJ78_9HEXA|nr:unnamed protein product [Allacma fusca]
MEIYQEKFARYVPRHNLWDSNGEVKTEALCCAPVRVFQDEQEYYRSSRRPPTFDSVGFCRKGRLLAILGPRECVIIERGEYIESRALPDNELKGEKCDEMALTYNCAGIPSTQGHWYVTWFGFLVME